MASKELKFKVWPDTVRGTDPDAKERGITSPSDWRNGDVIIELRGARIETRDEAYRSYRGSVEPDWSKGYYAWQDHSGQTRELFSGKGEPPEWVKQAHRDGLTLEGVIILRDPQYHG